MWLCCKHTHPRPLSPSAGQPRDPSWLRPGVKYQPAQDKEDSVMQGLFLHYFFFPISLL